MDQAMLWRRLFKGNHICQQPSDDSLIATSGLAKNRGLRGGLFGLWPNMSHASTYAKSFIKLPLDEADAGSLKTNELTN